jgi:DNA-binding transcriptional LysR family regulator
MELKHLRYFVAVAEELHFSRAAARLHIAQPPLSQMIRRLEQELGLKLFERTKRRVTLTAAGKVFLEEARGTLARADSAVYRVKRAARGEVGSLKVGFIPWADFTTIFSEIIRRFGERQPQVRLDFNSISTPEHMNALTEGRVDVGFFAPPTPPANLAHQVVLSDSVVVVLPRRHPLARRRIIPLEALAHEPHILVARDRVSSYYDLLISLFRHAGFTLQVRHHTDHPQTTLALVAAGIGVSLVPASLENIRRPGVVYRPMQPSTEVRMIAAWRHDNDSPVLANFVEVMREVVRTGKQLVAP